jgi:hypothetical protein
MPLRNPLFVAMLVAVALAACTSQAERATREAVLPLLEKEAAAMKADGERMDPGLGVKSTWSVESVEVSEQAGNAAQPWRGTIRFKIQTRMRDADGTETNDRLDKRFDYAYDQASGQWRMQPGPPR